MAKGFLYDNGNELITREDVSEVPSGSAASAGDVLTLDTSKKPKWTTPESELPSTGSASVGDVLTLDEDKEPVWSAPSGGGGDGIIVLSIDEEGTPVSSDYYPLMYNGNQVSYDDIQGWLEDGKIVYVKVSISQEIVDNPSYTVDATCLVEIPIVYSETATGLGSRYSVPDPLAQRYPYLDIQYGMADQTDPTSYVYCYAYWNIDK